MDTSIFEKFNQKFDSAALAESAKASGTRKTEFEEVPFGSYEVRITKLELRESKKGDPMAAVWFKILTGDYAGQMIFMYQTLTTGFGVRRFCDFLSALTDDVEVEFKDFVQFAETMQLVYDDITGKYEYELDYEQNDRGFKTFEIVQRFDADGSNDHDDLPF